MEEDLFLKALLSKSNIYILLCLKKDFCLKKTSIKTLEKVLMILNSSFVQESPTKKYSIYFDIDFWYMIFKVAFVFRHSSVLERL